MTLSTMCKYFSWQSCRYRLEPKNLTSMIHVLLGLMNMLKAQVKKIRLDEFFL